MTKTKEGGSLIIKLLASIIIGIVIGLIAPENLMIVLETIKHFLGQIIFFTIPLVILGFIAPAIAELKANASRFMGITILLAYLSSVGAAAFAVIVGYIIIPHLSIASNVGDLREIPAPIIELNVPQLFGVMSALVLALMLGLAVANTKAETMKKLLSEFQKIVLYIVQSIIIPILPIFIATTFAGLAYEGSITRQLPVFIQIIILVIMGHYIWLAVLYALGGAVSGINPLNVLKHYGPAYMTAVGTMSSAATLPVALRCIHKNEDIPRHIQDFVIPLCSTVHLCGSVLTETFFVMAVSQILYGAMPPLNQMITFILLLGLFGIAAPGVPGGTVMASLGLITGVLGFDQSGVALMLSIFALQDSFGTACNVTGDGAIALMVTGIAKRYMKGDESAVQG
ncbi:MAG: dicarboxylate/amino acid:cation symporter [Tepidanaerobacteraceae bacterium]|jgi:Na+/H+-dicarboxylate symporter|nr:dicarboxylate/amino acid:cation symporter [Tepidanaerobacter sp.]HQA60955.1 dicarboxylate/amino acid:cation symporter [Tepidanaerobacteraceae bacterium]HQE06539.1 dicarboxylate/amino acid:cation symporter [Tepidanaerobacteraceae bacterium]